MCDTCGCDEKRRVSRKAFPEMLKSHLRTSNIATAEPLAPKAPKPETSDVKESSVQ